MLIQRLKGGVKITAGTGVAYLKPQEVRVQRKDGSEFVINSPGEYDIAQIYVEFRDIGEAARNPAAPNLKPTESAMRGGNCVVLESEGFTLVYLPEPPQKLAADDLTFCEHVDVLMIPGRAGKLVTQLVPAVVIALDEPEKIARELGSELPQEEKSLRLRSPNDLPEDTELVRLG